MYIVLIDKKISEQQSKKEAVVTTWGLEFSLGNREK
jgi:hypothetical protein